MLDALANMTSGNDGVTTMLEFPSVSLSAPQKASAEETLFNRTDEEDLFGR